MAVYDGFFDAYYNEETGEYDRAYGSSDFTQYFGQLIGSGVCIAADPDSCRVSLSGGRALVNMGYLFIRGYWLKVADEPYAIDLTGTGPLAVTASLNTGKKMIELEAVPAAESYPADTLVLAVADPGAGTVEDTRYDTGVCGVIDSMGGLSDKAAYAIEYIEKEIGPKFEQIEADIKAQEDRLDEEIRAVGQVVEKIAPLPVGTIKFSANPDLGEEWLRCDGRFVSKEEYPQLVPILLDNPGLGGEGGLDFYWSKATLPKKTYWSSIAYGNGRFVAVVGSRNSTYQAETSNLLAYSLDGIIWKEAHFPAEAHWSSVTYGNGLFVAVSGCYEVSSIAAYSADGITWTQTALPSKAYWSSVTYGNGKFVAVAGKYYDASGSAYYKDDIVAYSVNGKSWSKAALPSKAYWSSVAYGNGKFVAVSSDKITAYSSDAVEWVLASSPKYNWMSVVYGNGKFVAVSYNESNSDGTSDKGMYSPDGVTWIEITLPYGTWSGIAYGNGLFVAVAGGLKRSSIAAYSTDGITWTQATLPSQEVWSSVVYGNGKFVAVAGSYNPSSPNNSEFEICNFAAYADPFNSARLPTLTMNSVPGYIKAKESGEAGR